MQAKTNRRRNQGSKTTPSQDRAAAVVSTGSKRTVAVKGRRGSSAGYENTPRAYLATKGGGYLAKSAQSARTANKRTDVRGGDSPAFIPIKKSNPHAMSTIGFRPTGASLLLKKRMELNNI